MNNLLAAESKQTKEEEPAENTWLLIAADPVLGFFIDGVEKDATNDLVHYIKNTTGSSFQDLFNISVTSQE